MKTNYTPALKRHSLAKPTPTRKRRKPTLIISWRGCSAGTRIGDPAGKRTRQQIFAFYLFDVVDQTSIKIVLSASEVYKYRTYLKQDQWDKLPEDIQFYMTRIYTT